MPAEVALFQSPPKFDSWKSLNKNMYQYQTSQPINLPRSRITRQKSISSQKSMKLISQVTKIVDFLCKS